MLKALKEQNKIVAGVGKGYAEQIIKKYKGKIQWENAVKGIAWVPDEYRDEAMTKLRNAGYYPSETGFSSGFYVELV